MDQHRYHCRKCHRQFETTALYPSGYRILCEKCDRVERPDLHGIAVPDHDLKPKQNTTAVWVICGFLAFCGWVAFYSLQQQQLNESFERIAEDHAKAQRDLTSNAIRAQAEIERSNRAMEQVMEREMERARSDAQKSLDEFNRSISKPGRR